MTIIAMKTTVTIYDNELLESVCELTGSSTKTRAVNLALEDWVRRMKREAFLRLRGKVKFDLDLEQIRNGEGTAFGSR